MPEFNPQQWKRPGAHMDAMELRADNPKDGSSQFYQAIRDFAKY